MKNITVSVPDDVYRAARIAAAGQGTSVSALVAEHLRQLSTAAADFQRRKALQDALWREVGRLSASDNLSRDELHDRASLR